MINPKITPDTRRSWILFASTFFTMMMGWFALTSISVEAQIPPASMTSNSALGKLLITREVISYIAEQYTDPTRVKPTLLTVAALRAIEQMIPQVYLQVDDEKKPQKMTIRVGVEERQFSLKDIKSIWVVPLFLRDAFAFIDPRLPPETNRQDLEYAAINGLLAELDPHSMLMEPRYLQDLKMNTRGEFGGLGIVIGIRDEALTIISPIEGTPADKAGLKALDNIVKIGDESTINMGVDEAADRLRGKPGTTVSLWISRKAFLEPKRFDITRAIIKVESVTHKTLDIAESPDALAYVRVKQFQDNTAKEVFEAVQSIRSSSKKNIRGMILDLRNNPGGLLPEAIRLTDLFLHDGVIVVTEEGASKERDETKARSNSPKIDLPLIVLVNGGSASASEIVSGAIKNRDRGIVLGEQTFGKGSVQQVFDFRDGSALKLTIGQYLTPGDESIQGVGITPDILVREVVVDQKDALNLFQDILLKEGDLESHLDNKQIKHRKPLWEIPVLTASLSDSEKEERAASEKFREDDTIRIAKSLLSVSSKTHKEAMLKDATSTIEKTIATEKSHIAETLKTLDVDWSLASTPTTPSTAALSMRVVSSSMSVDKKYWDLTLEAHNAGQEPLYQVYAITESSMRSMRDREYLFGKLDPQQSKQWTVRAALPKELSARHDVVRVRFHDYSTRDIGQWDIPISIPALPQPAFSYSVVYDDRLTGDGDGMLDDGETVDTLITITNTGSGIAQEPQVFLRNEGGPEVFIEQGRATLKPLAIGETKVVRLRVRLQKDAEKAARATVKNGQVNLYEGYAQMSLSIFDNVSGEFSSEVIRIPIGERFVPLKKSSTTTIKLEPNTLLHSSCSGQSPSNMRIPTEGAVVLGRIVQEQCTAIQWGDYLGFLHQKPIASTKKKVSEQPERAVLPIRTAPRIRLEQSPQGEAVLTDQKKMVLKFHLQDEEDLHEVVIYVGKNKAAYKRFDNNIKSGTFDVATSLRPGINLVTAIVRETGDYTRRAQWWIFHTQGDPLAIHNLSDHSQE